MMNEHALTAKFHTSLDIMLSYPCIPDAIKHQGFPSVVAHSSRPWVSAAYTATVNYVPLPPMCDG
ncbi:hypothetical protein SAMN05421863_11183 [Nitrosomonas communis]|uniref:Uncharacterized protein n=1 Tax=Nitrosomonas communis TaxID=44574 RepID=A0A1I4WRJ4_9PROT|nr:hypothetical protein SAMN05421863_11183 [Nitrosomonas communis]